jgi:hypothetical protein
MSFAEAPGLQKGYLLALQWHTSDSLLTVTEQAMLWIKWSVGIELPCVSKETTLVAFKPEAAFSGCHPVVILGPSRFANCQNPP